MLQFSQSKLHTYYIVSPIKNLRDRDLKMLTLASSINSNAIGNIFWNWNSYSCFAIYNLSTKLIFFYIFFLLGIAYQRLICDPEHSISITAISTILTVVADTAAHELGHRYVYFITLAGYKYYIS